MAGLENQAGRDGIEDLNAQPENRTRISAAGESSIPQAPILQQSVPWTPRRSPVRRALGVARLFGT